jgi:hypothetical protein
MQYKFLNEYPVSKISLRAVPDNAGLVGYLVLFSAVWQSAGKRRISVQGGFLGDPQCPTRFCILANISV